MSFAPETSRSGRVAAIEAALDRIPPLWPLRHFVAVNPFAGLADHPFADACTVLERTVGAAPLQSPTDYLTAWRNGTIAPQDLDGITDATWTRERLVAGLEADPGKTRPGPLPTVADLLDQERPRAHWSVFIVEEISKWCAIQWDENQSTWRSPWQSGGLYGAWREAAQLDGNPEAFGLTGFRRFVRSLPLTADECIDRCVDHIAPPGVNLADFLHRQLATIAGWAGHAQYRVREDRMRGRPNSSLRELLAIRLAYDAALFHAFKPSRQEPRDDGGSDANPYELLARWQLAYEAGYQRELARQLVGESFQPSDARPVAQVIFCIDVRSEIFRRHLEASAPGIQTVGFAGFFGFPIAHRSAESPAVENRCPALLVPPLETEESLPPEELVHLASAAAEAGAWKAFQNSATSCFSFVESVGLAFGTTLGRGSSRLRPVCANPARPIALGDAGTLEFRTTLAEGALRNMSLTTPFARLVLVCGHGSQSANNPYASGLDCGACGGHAGDVNARLAASVLNDPAVRHRLRDRGLVLPEDTVFLAGLHNTTTDEVTLFNTAQVPPTHFHDLTALRSALAAAGAATRRERAPSLGLGGLGAEALAKALQERASDISQVRPEWGLANNAALIVAPRRRTARLKLDGRTFLHDYEESLDPDSKVLTLILCAPVVVASWINLQYYASRVDPQRYGSGNKVLHNVAGGLGVLEGNGGDLRVGLPLQSIHDGERFIHEPRRLSVFIEAERSRIHAVLARQPAVRRLFDHGWIHLFALEGNQCHRYTAQAWIPLVQSRLEAIPEGEPAEAGTTSAPMRSTVYPDRIVAGREQNS